ncbi:MAG: response regulator [Nitrosopumilaceae archaeon]|nr:response regulator [Nitrosopumilaceae archaeon]
MSKSVIVIDDDYDTVQLFSEILEENGIKVVGSGYNGKSALDLYKKHSPDAVLVDIMMPNGSGFYAIKKIQEYDPNAKLIAVTADMSSVTEEKLTKLEIPIIYKPFKMDVVLSTIKN